LLLGVGAGCRWPWEPEAGPIIGTVSYPDGARASVAFISVYGQRMTYTDWSGHYKLLIQGSVGDSVIVYASDFCRGSCGETHYGFTKAVLRRSPQVVDIVMDHGEAI
jgi:hypothetical protein